MAQRQKTNRDIEARVLMRTARRCCLCFRYRHDFDEKIGQIAHLDHDSSNSSEENLVFLCLEHHSLYDSRNSQHKNFTIMEVIAARDELYSHVTTEHELSDGRALQRSRGDLRAAGTAHKSVTGTARSPLRRSLRWARLVTDVERIHQLAIHSNGRIEVVEEMGDPPDIYTFRFNCRIVNVYGIPNHYGESRFF